MAPELNDPEINVEALRLDEDMYQAAKWAHLLKTLIDADEMSWPIETVADLEPLFALGEGTVFYDGRRLTRPDPELFPAKLFPIDTMPQFLQVALTMIKLHHAPPFVPLQPKR